MLYLVLVPERNEIAVPRLVLVPELNEMAVPRLVLVPERNGCRALVGA